MSAIHGKVAVVTGAGSGIGRELAHGLARRGARLALADIDEVGLAETATTVKSLGADVHTTRLDVSDREAFQSFADDVVDHFGVVHQLYNNAGIASRSGNVLDADWAALDRVLAVNLSGVINGSKIFLPHLIASGDGHIVNISSLNGIMGQSGLSAYCASKFAVRGFTEALHGEMITGNHPVRVTVVHPGGVKTNIANSALAEAERNGTLTAEQRERARAYNDKLLRMPAETAAATILKGVEAGKSRILVGNDAKAVDLLVRLLPRRYPQLASWFSNRVIDSRR